MGVNIDLSGRTAIVTGAAQGLGVSSAQCLAQAGATVYIADIQAELAAKTAGELAGAGLDVRHIVMDVTDRPGVRAHCEAVHEAHGRLDILVNNAAFLAREFLADVTDESYRKPMEVDLHGSLICSQEAARLMRADGGGVIVNMASTAGVVVLAERGVYSLAKSAVIQLTRLAAFEWGPYGIRVNSVSPGVMVSPVTEGLLGTEEARTRYLSRIPLGRFGTAQDVGPLVTFLASDYSSYVTGHNFVVDGGYTLGTH
jgi:3-oxoacyl-[acyl-carrier protein] reductase